MSSKPLSTTSHTSRVFDALAHQYRRVALSCLVKHDEWTTLDELAEYVAMEVELRGRVQNGELARGIAIQLYHAHLPILENAGLVEYDENSRRLVKVTAGGRDLETLVSEEMPSG